MKQKNVILMVVAVGCGLVAALLTSQMSGKTVETVEVVVATKDLPVGTMFTKEELPKLVKTKKVPKDGLPPAFVVNADELADKRLSRPIRAEETINPNDLNKGVSLPDGHDLVSLSVGASNAASGFIVPGCRVDVMASVRLGNTLKVFDLLVNTLIVNVNHDMTNTKGGVYPDINQVGFALTPKESVVLEMARARGCSLTLKLRNSNKTAEADKGYKIDDVIKLLQDPENPAKVVTGNPNPSGEPGGPLPQKDPNEKPKVDETPKVTEAPKVEEKPNPRVVDITGQPKFTGPDAAPAPTEKVLMVKVLVAKRTIEPNTEVTADLVAKDFEVKTMRAEDAPNALGDFKDVMGKFFKVGVGKGNWVTPELLDLQGSKVKPQDPFLVPKAAEPKPPVEPTTPAPVKKNYHDVTVYSNQGTTILRYEETTPGKWKFVGELTPEQAAQGDKPAAPKAKPDASKAD